MISCLFVHVDGYRFDHASTIWMNSKNALVSVPLSCTLVVISVQSVTSCVLPGTGSIVLDLSIGLILTRAKLRTHLEQVVYNYVPLSPSTISSYWSKDSDVVWLGR